MLEIEDSQSKCLARTCEEVKRCLSKVYENESNAFYISKSGYEYPLLTVHIKGEMAVVHYLPEDGNPGFKSQGQLLEPGSLVEFYDSVCGDPITVPSESVVRVSDAVQAAIEFLQNGGLPTDIDWLEL